MKERTVGYGLWVLVVATLLALFGYAFLALTDIGPHCEDLLVDTDLQLRYARHCIRVFNKDMGRLPESLRELYEYGKALPKKDAEWRFPFREFISPDWETDGSREHADLDGGGGFFYNPENGDIRVNLTKPLHHYWRSYSGPKKDEIPADW